MNNRNITIYTCTTHPVWRFTKILTFFQIKMAVSTLEVFYKTATAILPTRATPMSAGLDLYSDHDCCIPAHGKGIVSTGLKLKLPTGCYGQIAPRSGLATSHHLDVGAGVVDSDYTGIVSVVLFNHGPVFFVVKTGQCIAQLICKKISYPVVRFVPNPAPATERGAAGFGSSGDGLVRRGGAAWDKFIEMLLCSREGECSFFMQSYRPHVVADLYNLYSLDE